MRKLTMLGTGSAMVTHCYNTCFFIENEDGSLFLTDAGGGNTILRQLECAGFTYQHCHHLFVTHGHTDHILGVIWVLRKIADLMNKGKYDGVFHVICHDVVCQMLMTFTQLTLKKKDFARIGSVQQDGRGILFHVVRDGERLDLPFAQLIAFDIQSTKAKQFGYELTYPDGLRLTCLGDEPYSEHERIYAAGADWLLSEAFCKYEDRERFRPYEKNHSTVKEASELAETLQVKHLLLYHTEDKTIETRRQAYAAEARLYYHGPVYVPDDLETIVLDDKTEQA